MSTEIELHRQQPLAQKVEWVKLMATASLLPREYRDQPGNLLYAVEYADALGIDRINAITSIHVINGKPSASADLIAGLLRKAGHKLRISGDDTHAVAQLVRQDDPDFTFEAAWTREKAQAAGLWGSGNWKKYPGAMLRARAITEVARMGASDALYGVVYTPEEMGAEVDAEGVPVEGRPVRQKAGDPVPGGDHWSTAPQNVAESGEGKTGAGEAPSEATDSATPTPEDGPPTSSGGSDATAAPAAVPEPEGPDGSGSPSSTSGPSPEPVLDEDGAVPAEIIEDEEAAEPRCGATQTAAMAMHFGRLGVADKTERLYTLGVLVGRKIATSSKELSVSEATRILELLATLKDTDALQAAVIAADEKGGV